MGITGPPTWLCKHIGPPTKCLSGWAVSKDGWCEPILPTSSCSKGTMEVIGQPACQPIGDCGTGSYGKIKTTAKTVYVDAAYKGSSSDGSLAKPFAKISDALSAAPSGGHIAVAAGLYYDYLNITKPITIAGRCAKQVTIKNMGRNVLYTIKIRANNVSLSGLTVSGVNPGVTMDGGDAQLSQMSISDCGGFGLQLSDSKAILLDSLVANNSELGIYAQSGSTVSLIRTVVRDTQPGTQKQFGNALQIGAHTLLKDCTLLMSDSVIANNMSTSIFLLSVNATIQRSVIKDTKPRPSNGAAGVGVTAEMKSNKSAPSTLKIEDSLVANNRYAGIYLGSSNAVITRSVVRDTREVLDTKGGGYGIQATLSAGRKVPSSLEVHQSVVSRNMDVGVFLLNAKATISESMVQDTRPNPLLNLRGNGIVADNFTQAAPLSAVTVLDSLVQRNHDIGLAVLSSSGTLTRTIIRGTLPTASDKRNGVGLLVSTTDRIAGTTIGSSLTMRDCKIANNRTISAHLYQTNAVVERTILQDTQPMASDNSLGHGLSALSSTLKVSDSVVMGSHGAGINIHNTDATLGGVVIQQTSPTLKDKMFGLGLQATADSGKEKDFTLTMHRSMVLDNRTVGLNLFTNATLSSSVIGRTLKEVASDEMGDAIFAGGTNSKVNLDHCLVYKSARAGLLFDGASGAVTNSVFRQGTFSIVINGASSPAIGESNLYEDNDRDPISFGKKLTTTKLPKPPKL